MKRSHEIRSLISPFAVSQSVKPTSPDSASRNRSSSMRSCQSGGEYPESTLDRSVQSSSMTPIFSETVISFSGSVNFMATISANFLWASRRRIPPTWVLARRARRFFSISSEQQKMRPSRRTVTPVMSRCPLIRNPGRHHPAQTDHCKYIGTSMRCMEAKLLTFSRSPQRRLRDAHVLARGDVGKPGAAVMRLKLKGRRFELHRLRMRELKDPFRTPPGAAKAPEGPERSIGGGARNERKHRNGRAVLLPLRRGGGSDRSPGGRHRAGPDRDRTVAPFSRPSGALLLGLGRPGGSSRSARSTPGYRLPSLRNACAYMPCPITSFKRSSGASGMERP